MDQRQLSVPIGATRPERAVKNVGITSSHRPNRGDIPMSANPPILRPGTTAAASQAESYQRKVLVLYTGGTMGMMPDKSGSLAPKAGYLTKVIQELPELKRDGMPIVTVTAFDELIDSASMGPKHWIEIAELIESNYFAFDGFVVITGTDTMAYASSALSFMMENLGKPIVFTGSQIPLYQVYNDAHRNLIVSIIFAANSDYPEVMICFNDKLLRANRTTKIDSAGLNAFHSPNFPPLATLGARIQQNMELILPPPKGALKVHKRLESDVVVLKLVPGFDDESIEAMITHSTSLKAIVLELYGMGNGPAQSKLTQMLKTAREKGIIVVVLSQCLRGGVSMNTYSIGKDLVDAGVLTGEDMTAEACVTKLSYLLGRLTDRDVISKFMLQSVRGELTSNSARGQSLMDSLNLGTNGGANSEKMLSRL